MRVLHLCKYFPPFAGGMESFVGDLLDELQAKGIECTALAHGHQPMDKVVSEVVGAGVKVIRVPTLGRLLYVPIAPAFITELHRIVASERPDIIHIHMPNASAFAAILFRNCKKLPWVVHWHADVVASKLDRRLALAYPCYRPFEQAVLAHSAAVIATSPPYLAASEPLKKWAEKCEIIPLGLNPRRFPIPSEGELAWANAAWGEAPYKVLCVGRLTYYKGQEILVRALKGLDGVRAILVGCGDRYDSLTREIREHGLTNIVELVGYQSDGRVRALLETCDALCLPSLERSEAFGMVLLEVMNVGKPVVVSAVPGAGMSWVVEQGVTGILVEPGNSEALRTALERLMKNPEWAKVLGSEGKKRFDARFGIARIADDIITLYQKVAQ